MARKEDTRGGAKMSISENKSKGKAVTTEQNSAFKVWLAAKN
jgi:hypothetical protein